MRRPFLSSYKDRHGKQRWRYRRNGVTVALPIEKPRTFLSPGYQDNLGWGFGTALGAKAAMPDRKVLAIAGDGGFLYQMGELATAARHNLAVVVVVLDNGAFGNVKPHPAG